MAEYHYQSDEDSYGEEDVTFTSKRYGKSSNLRNVDTKEYFSSGSLSNDERGVELSNLTAHPSNKPPKPPSDFGTVDSLSSIHSKDSDQTDAQQEIADVYHELQHINSKLKREFKILNEKEIMLKEKERSLNASKSVIESTIEAEVKKRVNNIKKEFQNEMENMQQILREKTKEHKRLKENFDTLKLVNDSLRKELETLQEQHAKLDKQSSSLQARLVNLQRKSEHRRDDDSLVGVTEKIALVSQSSNRSSRDTKPKTKPVSGSSHDVMGALLEWVCEAHLRQAASYQSRKLSNDLTEPAFLHDKCLRVLPHMVDLLREQSMCHNGSVLLPCLQFTYWSLQCLDQSPQQQQIRSSLSSTLRRLGQELYRPRAGQVLDRTGDVMSDSFNKSDQHEITKGKVTTAETGLYFRTSNLHMRFLSSLIIIKTVTQVDHLAHVYESLRSDLKSDEGKKLFMYYQATPVILTHLKVQSKGLLVNAIDIFLQMTVDSPFLLPFLQSCGNEIWFRSIAMVWRSSSVDVKILEKLSILLQKLSKTRSHKKYFEVFGILTTAQELLRTKGTENSFLLLNLKSILFNMQKVNNVT